MIISVPETTEGSTTKARCLPNHSVRCNETWHVPYSTCKRVRFQSSRSTNARSNTAKVSTRIRCTTLPPPFPSDAHGCKVLVHRPLVGSGCSTVNTRSPPTLLPPTAPEAHHSPGISAEQGVAAWMLPIRTESIDKLNSGHLQTC